MAKGNGCHTVVPPHLLGAQAIAAAFGVHVSVVREWRRQGAPVFYLGKKYQANYGELWEWLRERLIDKEGERE